MHGKRARSLSTTPERPQQPQSLYTDTSRRVIRQVPIRSGSSIQSASAVPTCAHWVALMTSSCIGLRARAVDTHGAMSARKGSETTAIHAVGSGKRTTRSEEHTSELQSRLHLVCRLLL